MKYFFSGFCLLLSFLALRASAQKYDYSMPAPVVTSDSSAGRLKCILGGHEDDITDASWSPDSKYVVTSSRDQSAMVWEAASGKRVMTLYSTEEIDYVTWSKDGTKIATSSDYPLIDLWDAKSGNKLLHLDGRSFAWSPDGTSFSYFTLDYTLHILDASTFATLHTISLKNKLIYSAYWSPNSKNIACNATDSSVVVLDVAAESMVYSVALRNKFTKDIHWNSESTRIIIATDSSFLTVDGKTGMLLSTTTNLRFRGPIVWSNDGNRIAFCGDSLQVWDTQTWMKLFSENGHTAQVTSISWSPDDKQIVSASNDKSLIIWDVSSGKKLFTLLGHRNNVHVVRWSPDGHHILSGGWKYISNPFQSSKDFIDFTAILWDPTTGTLLHRLMPHIAKVISCQWSPDGSQIASSGIDSTVIVWNIPTGDTVLIFRGHSSNNIYLQWSADGKQILSFGSDSTLILWNALTGKILHTLHSSQSIERVYWSPLGNQFAIKLMTFISIYDATSYQLLYTIPKKKEDQWLIYWSPDGLHVAVSTPDSITILDGNTWNSIFTYQTTSSELSNIQWCPDNARISILDGNSVHIWNYRTGQHILSKPGVRFSLIPFWKSNGKEFDIFEYGAKSILRFDAFTGVFIDTVGHYTLYPGDSLISYYGIWNNDGTKVMVNRQVKDRGYYYVSVYDAITGVVRFQFPLHSDEPSSSILWCPNGKYIASVRRSTIKILSMEEITGVQETFPLQPSARTFSLYPNPTDNILHLHCTTTSALPTTVRVLNLLGQEMLTTQVPAAVNEWTLPMGHLPTGVYLVEWNGAVQKVVVH